VETGVSTRARLCFSSFATCSSMVFVVKQVESIRAMIGSNGSKRGFASQREANPFAMLLLYKSQIEAAGRGR
jgi:hypothetical protein